MNVRQMCRVLTGAGYRVDLATYPLGEDVAMPGLTIHRPPRPPWIDSVPIGFSPRKLVLDACLALLVWWLLLTRRYDAVHAVEEAVFFALPFTWFGKRLIYDLDSRMSAGLRDAGVVRSARVLAVAEALERLALARSSAAITVCRALTDAARSLDPAVRVFQIEDTPLEEASRDPDPARVEALRREWKLDGRPVAVYTGNLERYQGLELLLRAAPLLRARMPRIAVVLVGGDRRDVEALRAEAVRDGLGDALLVVGARPPDEMPEWMALADVLVSPRSHGENTPLKIYTYMRSGVPIVATDLPTHTQVLDRANAILVRPTPDGIADGIARALADRATARQLGRRARELAEREYSFGSFERKLLTAYREVLA
jgi:glycosyltransferase involved in cell wall biosynthesis